MGDLFNSVRRSVTARQAAEAYGLAVDRHGKALCPWHDDRRPSLSFDPRTGRCKCFACGAGGSAIDLAACLLGCSPLGAAQRLNADFGIGADDAGARPEILPTGETPAQHRARVKAEANRQYAALCDRLHAAEEVLARFTPETAEHSHEFLRALQALADAQDGLEQFNK